ncbi:MAG: histidine triad nucleotide-binding protein [Actinomycetota bacterium]|nr:histidine triad nucleotide-binding protein [Actinomycetota bacterium]
MSADCLFCKIVAGEIPSTKVHETERTFAFRDIAPHAPTHVLVVPKEHHADVASVVVADPGLLADVYAAAVEVAQQEGLAGGYRLIANTGPDSGQTVFHLHVHVLGGRAMGVLA